MNRIFTIAVLICAPFLLFAQSQTQNTSNKINFCEYRTIEVIGAATAELEPDEAFVSFTIKDYTLNNKVIGIDKSEANIKEVLKSLDIDQVNLVVVNIYGYMNYNEGSTGVYQSRKTFRLKLTDFSKINEFISKVDKACMESINIDEASHSDLSEHYQYIRTQAIRNAKDKANELLLGLGEKCGRVLQIEEMPIVGNQLTSQTNAKYQDSHNSTGSESHKISVSYQVKVKFEIK